MIRKSDITTMIGQYKKIKLLGKGRFGECWCVENTESKKQFAAKFISSATMTVLEFDKAFDSVKRVKAPHLVEYVEYVTRNGYAVVMEYCSRKLV